MPIVRPGVSSSNPLPELLAPAGSFDAACAALAYGADAVYLGLKQFSARDDAPNFSLDELADLAGYARSFHPPRKVYVTVNTLIREDEIPALVENLQPLAALPVDAVIVQDLGVLHILRTHFPDLPVHASTQMAIHNRPGVEAARDLGIKRVIPARELTRGEIADLCSTPDMEIEIFLHGALCYSYSGLCLFSALEHGPSGNRGGCLYNCRNWFEPAGAFPAPRAGMPFSMKDLCLAGELDALLPTGISSLKIEGRKKSPLYVAAVTHYYQNMLDQSASETDLQGYRLDVESIFSRPATSLFIGQLRHPQATDTLRSGHQGAPIGTITRVERGKLHIAVTAGDIQRYDGLQIEIPGTSRPCGFGVSELFRLSAKRSISAYEVKAGDIAVVPLPPDAPGGLTAGLTVYRSSSQAVKQRYKWHTPKPGLHRPRKAVVFTLEVSSDCLSATAVWKELAATVCVDGPFEAARNPAGTEKAVVQAFGKLGDTPFEQTACHLRNPQNLFVPVSILNELRRSVVEQLEAVLGEEMDKRRRNILEKISAPSPLPSLESPRWVIKTDQPGLLTGFSADSLSRAAELIIDIGRVSGEDLLCEIRTLRERGNPSLRFALPTVIRAHRLDDIKEKIQALQAEGCATWQIGNIGHLKLLDPGSNTINADWPLYCWNSPAVALLEENNLEGVTVSPEQSGEDIADLLPNCSLPATVPVYQDVPLFHSAVCAKASLDQACPGLENCDFECMTFSNSKGREFLAINNACETIVVGQTPFLRDHELSLLKNSGIAALRVDFMWRDYPLEEAENIWLGYTGKTTSRPS